LEQFEDLMGELKVIAGAVGRKMATATA
jgi:hypothetical protein